MQEVHTSSSSKTTLHPGHSQAETTRRRPGGTASDREPEQRGKDLVLAVFEQRFDTGFSEIGLL